MGGSMNDYGTKIERALTITYGEQLILISLICAEFSAILHFRHRRYLGRV